MAELLSVITKIENDISFPIFAFDDFSRGRKLGVYSTIFDARI